MTPFPYYPPNKPAAGVHQHQPPLVAIDNIHQLPRHAQPSSNQTFQGLYSVSTCATPTSATIPPWTPSNAHGAFYFPSASPQDHERFRTVSPLGFIEMSSEGGQQLLNPSPSNQQFQSWASSATSTPRQQYNPFWSPSPQTSPTHQQQGYGEGPYQYFFTPRAEPPVSNNGNNRGGMYGVTERLYQGAPVGFGESSTDKASKGLGPATLPSADVPR